ncbi:hypothetical protein D3C83_130420 [compost metagenome]
MQVAVAEVTEHDQRRVLESCLERAAHFRDVALHVGDGEAHVVGEDRIQARELLDVVAHRPQLVALGA